MMNDEWQAEIKQNVKIPCALISARHSSFVMHNS